MLGTGLALFRKFLVNNSSEESRKRDHIFATRVLLTGFPSVHSFSGDAYFECDSCRAHPSISPKLFEPVSNHDLLAHTIMTQRVIVNHEVMGFSCPMNDPSGHSLFASQLKAARVASGLTQHAVAERIGISQRTYAAYEGDQKVPELKRLPKVAEALGVSVGDLFESNDVVSPTKCLSAIRREVGLLEAHLRTLIPQPSDESAESQLEELRAENAALKKELEALRARAPSRKFGQDKNHTPPRKSRGSDQKQTGS